MNQIRLWQQPAEAFDSDKARRELCWQARPSEQAVRQGFTYLNSRVRR